MTVADVHDGSAGDDVVNGDSTANTILGYAGNDTINGGTGNDTITGGAGADTFAYAEIVDSRIGVKADHILDFVAGVDQLDLGAINANNTLGGNLAADFSIVLDSNPVLTVGDFIL